VRRGAAAFTTRTCGVTHLGKYLKDIGHDQADIWTSPFGLSPKDAFWLVPFAGATGVALHYDAQAQQELGIDKSRIDTSNTISTFGSPYATFAGASGLYFLGLATHNEHLSQTGRLGAEAIADGSLVVEAMKLATNRERPNEGERPGRVLGSWHSFLRARWFISFWARSGKLGSGTSDCV
jgi:hypothetical protein